MLKIEIQINANSGATRSSTPTAQPSTQSPLPANVSRRIPPVTSRGQAYFWSQAWQEGEQETLAAPERGEGKVFSDALSAISWLLSSYD